MIAEIGINHNGSINLAKRMVIEAKKCGADCVKFQFFNAEKLIIPSALKRHINEQIKQNRN